MEPHPSLSVLVPVYNEVATVRALLTRVRAVPIPKEIIVVDDCSTDGTREAVEALRAEVGDTPENRLLLLVHEQNRGKGAAVRTGVAHVRGDIVVIQDADLEYDPAEYPRLIQPIRDGHADVVFGSRFAGSPRRVLFFWHMVANRLLTLLSNMCTNLNLTDMETCYKVFRADILKQIPIRSNRFGLEPELTAKVAHLRRRIYEIPIAEDGLPPRSFDTILCANVLEHIGDDGRALRAMCDLLTPGGRIVLIIPALRVLYGEIDRSIGHYRRYSRREIEEKLGVAGLRVEHVSYFNTLGVPGWFLNARLLRRRSVPGVQARLHDRLVPLLRVERRFRPPFGMSLLAVGQNTE